NGNFHALTKEVFMSRCNKIWLGACFPCMTGHCFQIGGTTKLLKLSLDVNLVKMF
ncbi:hypothetical protein B0J17DRAFT_572484, partial [Rhizoctonia solani]